MKKIKLDIMEQTEKIKNRQVRYNIPGIDIWGKKCSNRSDKMKNKRLKNKIVVEIKVKKQ